jgi:transposase
MATPRIPVQHLREILRQKLELKRSHREVARSIGVSSGGVATATTRARQVGLQSWSDIEALTDAALDERIFGPKSTKRLGRAPLPDGAYLHAELHRVGVTLQLLHLEYLEREPTGYRYTSFCEHYKQWLAKQKPSMRQVHIGGEKIFTDYSGKKPHLVDPSTGELVDVELFVAVLGASNYTYAEATRTQRVPDWIASHVRAFEFFGGVSRAVVPDQLKSGVTLACRYEPTLQRSYHEMAVHYGTVVLPARPGHPRDKAKVEAAVLVAQRWILAKLRNQTFHSIEALNERIGELLDELNDRTMRVYDKSRSELFEQLDKPALLPLPEKRFSYGDWKTVKVNIDYHVEYEHHYYSVPHTLLGEKLWIRATAATVEIFRDESLNDEARITSHARSSERGRHTTKPEHMPKAHQRHSEWSPSRIVRWAETIGPSTAKLAQAILEERPHPEQGYRSCLGILRLSKRFGNERLEVACARALDAGARSYRHVESILKHGLDRIAAEGEPQLLSRSHENVRGRDYYH